MWKVWLFFLAAGAAHAQGIRQAAPADGPGPPANYDAAAAYAPWQALSAPLNPGARVHRDERFGTPTFLWAAKGTPYLPAKPGSRPRAEEAARFHLKRFAAAYDMAPADVDTVPVRAIHDTGKGTIVVKLRQAIDGIEVFRDEMNIAMDRNYGLISISGFLPGAGGRAGRARLAAFALDPVQAIVAAARDLVGQPISVSRTGARGGYDLYAVSASPNPNLRMIEAVRVKRVYFHLPDRLEAGYYIELNLGAASSNESLHYGYVISAVADGVLYRNNYTVSDAYSYRVWADTTGLRAPFDGPAGNSPAPHPSGTLDGFQPVFIAPSLVTLQNGPISTSDPWLPPSATETTGNNVEAYADLVAPDGFSAGDFHATVTAANAFDRIYDTSAQPQSSQSQQMAAITQLFYNVNFFHDWYYDSGFDEAAGNAQEDNYGRGGIGGDSIKAEAQDYIGRNNANMSTPPDGGRPRMQMFIFDGKGPRQVLVNAPGGGPFAAGIADFGPQAFDFSADVVLADDGSMAPTQGCSALLAPAAGKIVLVDRGGCFFSQKAENVKAAGASGMIVVNNVTPGFVEMAPTTGFDDNIPSLMISQADGDTLKTDLLSVTTNVTLHRPQPLDRDATIDNQIVAHEWGHYISNRLIGDANGLTTNMARGLGEGWGDFHAMLLTVKAEDALVASNSNFAGVYALAGYTSGGVNPDGTPNQGWYFGIRRLPYSTDFSKNALTFKHISNGVPLPVGVPTAFGADGASNAEVHNTGEVWATMLWECYAGLLRDTLGAGPRLSFDQARDRMRHYLVAAYKLTPVNPTLLEARDALLAAAAAGDAADLQRFARAFARRGAGFGAVAPDRANADNVPVTESFVEATTTTLASSANPSVIGQAVTLTAKVSGTPTGSVTFVDGVTAIGSALLDGSGVASLATSALALGTHSITAQYPGDSGFSPSSSAALSQRVNPPPPPDFSVSASPAALTLAAGQSGAITFTVTPLNGLSQPVSLGCGSLPSRATCSFAPPSVTPDGTHAASTTLTIQTAANAGASGQLAGFGAFSLFSLGFLALRGPRRRAAACSLLLGIALLLAACGGGGGGGGGGGPGTNGTPPGTYSVAIVATFGATVHSAVVSVTVQ